MSSLVFAELLVPAYREKDHKRAGDLIRILTNFPNKSKAHGIIANDNDFLRLKDCLEIRLFDKEQANYFLDCIFT